MTKRMRNQRKPSQRESSIKVREDIKIKVAPIAYLVLLLDIGFEPVKENIFYILNFKRRMSILLLDIF